MGLGNPGLEMRWLALYLRRYSLHLPIQATVSWLLSWIVASPWYPLKLVRCVEYLKTVASCGIGSLRIGLRARLRMMDLSLASLQAVRLALMYTLTKPGIWCSMTVSGRLDEGLVLKEVGDGLFKRTVVSVYFEVDDLA